MFILSSGKSTQDVDLLLTRLVKTFRQKTRTPEPICEEVARRTLDEVDRMCQESKRIQKSGDVEQWREDLALHRVNQCLRYYDLGSNRGRIELQKTLSAIVYRYITSGSKSTCYQKRVLLIEDFLQGFYEDSLNAFRREYELSQGHSPRFMLECAEYMAFTERYGKRRIPLPGNRSQQLIILRSQTFSQQQPKDTTVDIDTAADGGFSSDSSSAEWNSPMMQQIRLWMANQEETGSLEEENLRESIIQELLEYLESRQQEDCAQYFILRLRDLNTGEIEEILGLTPRERDYLQQRFKYHLIRFALSHRWELVHEWLNAELEHRLGLTPAQWQDFTEKLMPLQVQILDQKQQGIDNQAIMRSLSLTQTQLDKQWLKILELAWNVRN